MTETAKKLGQIVFVPRKNGMIVQTPSFLVGEAGRIIYEAYQEAKAERFNGNKHFQLERKGDEVVGANVPDANLIDQVVRRYGVRVSLPKDWNEEFMRMTDGKHYTTANALVFRSLQDGYNEDNNRIAELIAESGKIDTVKISREPALITGFDIRPNEDEGYGFIAVPSKGFNVHYDERFLGKYSGWKFDEIDEIGMPVGLDKERGKRIWYTRKDGISRFVLNSYRNLSSYYDGLSGSVAYGRVVLVSAEGGAPNYEIILEQQRRSELLESLRGTRNCLNQIVSQLEGKK